MSTVRLGSTEGVVRRRTIDVSAPVPDSLKQAESKEPQLRATIGDLLKQKPKITKKKR